MTDTPVPSKEWNTPWRASELAVYDVNGELVAHTGITGNRSMPGEQLERMATMIAKAVNAYSAGEPRDGWPTDEHVERFGKWLAQEMPAGTVIGDPSWWPRKLLNAAYMYAAPPASSPPPASESNTQLAEFLRTKADGAGHEDAALFGLCARAIEESSAPPPGPSPEPTCEYEQDGYRIETECGDVFHLNACEDPPDHCGKCGKVLTIKQPSPAVRHTLDCDMVKHPNCTRCSCGSGLVTDHDRGYAEGYSDAIQGQRKRSPR